MDFCRTCSSSSANYRLRGGLGVAGRSSGVVAGEMAEATVARRGRVGWARVREHDAGELARRGEW
jgi:hypothetical protein